MMAEMAEEGCPVDILRCPTSSSSSSLESSPEPDVWSSASSWRGDTTWRSLAVSHTVSSIHVLLARGQPHRFTPYIDMLDTDRRLR